MNTLDSVKKIAASRFATHYPFLLTHMITRKCNGSCDMCSVKYINRTEPEMTTGEIYAMLDDASKTMNSYTVWGREPTLREDLGDVLKHAKARGMNTSVITNGYLLPRRAGDIGPYTDKLIVSLDFPDERHDEERKLRGTFRNAVEGIKEVKKYDTDVIINTVITDPNKGVIDDMIKLANQLDTKISFEPMDEYDYNRRIRTSEGELKTILRRLSEQKKKDKRIVNSQGFLSNSYENKHFVCHAPKIFVTVNEVGEVESCPRTGSRIFGNVKKSKLTDIFRTPEYQSYFKEAEECSSCNNLGVMESSLAYSFNPRSLMNLKDIIL